MSGCEGSEGEIFDVEEHNSLDDESINFATGNSREESLSPNRVHNPSSSHSLGPNTEGPSFNLGKTARIKFKMY